MYNYRNLRMQGNEGIGRKGVNGYVLYLDCHDGFSHVETHQTLHVKDV